MYLHLMRLRAQPLGFRLVLISIPFAWSLGGYWLTDDVWALWRALAVLSAVLANLAMGPVPARVWTSLTAAAVVVAETEFGVITPSEAVYPLLQLALHVGVALLVSTGLQALLERIVLLELVAHEALSGCFVLDLEGRLQWVSAPVGALVGSDPRSLAGRSLLDLAPPERRARWAEFIESARSRPEAVLSAVEIFPVGDRPTPVTVSLRPLHGLSRTYLLGCAEPMGGPNLWGRLFRTAMDSIEAAIALRNPAGVIVWQNAAFAKLTEVVPPAQESDTARRLAEVVAAAPPGERHSAEVTLPDGRMIGTEVYPVFHEVTGTLQAVISLSRDITERRQIQAAMEQAGRLVAIGQLAAGVAHNVNNILGSISLNAELLRIAAPDDVDRAARDILAAVERGSEVVGKLYRMVGTAGAPKLETLNLQQAVEQVVQLIERQASQQGVMIEAEVPDGLVAVADRSLLQQVLLNLALNSLHAMPEGGRLQLFACPVWPASTAIAVRDFGSGIAPEHMARLFSPFFTTRQNEGGTGLGLSTSLTMLQAMRGQIRIESKVGQGTTAWVELPTPK